MSEVEKIKELREATGLSFNEISKAMKQAGGDPAKAAELLKELGAVMAAKKSEREVHQGIIEAYIHSNKKAGAIVELLCETDFVAKNSDFQALARDLAMHVTAMKPATNEELLAQPFVKEPTITVKDRIHQAVAKLGENIQLNRFTLFHI